MQHGADGGRAARPAGGGGQTEGLRRRPSDRGAQLQSLRSCSFLVPSKAACPGDLAAGAQPVREGEPAVVAARADVKDSEESVAAPSCPPTNSAVLSQFTSQLERPGETLRASVAIISSLRFTTAPRRPSCPLPERLPFTGRSRPGSPSSSLAGPHMSGMQAGPRLMPTERSLIETRLCSWPEPSGLQIPTCGS